MVVVMLLCSPTRVARLDRLGSGQTGAALPLTAVPFRAVRDTVQCPECSGRPRRR